MTTIVSSIDAFANRKIPVCGQRDNRHVNVHGRYCSMLLIFESIHNEWKRWNLEYKHGLIFPQYQNSLFQLAIILLQMQAVV